MNPQMINKLRKMQKEMMEAQKALAEKVFVGSSGGVVEVEVKGSKELLRVKINKEAIVDFDDLELLEDVIVAAVNDAMCNIDEETERTMSKFTGGMPGGMGF